MAQALVDAGCAGHVVTFEIDKGNADKARHNLAAAGLAERVELHVGDSRELLPKVLEKEHGIRAAFLDASHLYADVMREFQTVLPKLADDALVLFDNTYRIADEGEDPCVNGFLRDMQGLYGGNLINMEFVSWYRPGLAIWQKQAKLLKSKLEMPPVVMR